MKSVCKIFIILVSILFAAAVEQKVLYKNDAVKNQRFKYPEVRRDESIVDDYYGKKV